MGIRQVLALAQCRVLTIFGVALLACPLTGQAQHSQSSSQQSASSAPANCSPKDPACQSLEKERIKQVRSRSFDPLDAKSVDHVDLECEEAKPLFGALSCNSVNGKPGLIKTVEDQTRALLSIRNNDWYRGIRTNVSTGTAQLSAIPVCNIVMGEGEDLAQAYELSKKNGGKAPSGVNHNWLPAGHQASSCGMQCGMKIKTSLFSGTLEVDDEKGHCDWEYGQYRGMVVQIHNHFKEKVFNEFENKRVKLVDIEGAKPCQELAADVIRLQKGVKKVTGEALAFVGDRAKAEKMRCPGSASGTGDEPGVIGACHMQSANLDLQVLWSKFLDCEIYWRGTKVVEDDFSSPDAFVNEIRAYVKPRCEGAGHCNKDGKSQCSGPLCCTDAMRTKLFNECYVKHVPQWLKQKLSKWRTSTPVERPGVTKPFSVGPSNADQNGAKSEGNGAPSSTSNDVLWALGIGALGATRRRKDSGERGAKVRVRLVLAVLGAFMLAVIGSGCDCDDNKQTCKPCIPPSQQSKGCLYKVCMQSVFMCVKRSKDGGYLQDEKAYESMDKDADDYTCIKPSSAAGDGGQIAQIFDTFSRKSNTCWAHQGHVFADELKEIANADADAKWKSFLKSHQLAEVDGDTAAAHCREIAGVTTAKNAAEYAAQAVEHNKIGSLSDSELAAFKERLTQRMQTEGDQTQVKSQTHNTASDPSCTSADPASGPDPSPTSYSNNGAQALEDARGLFGGASPDAEKAENKENPNKGGGSAVAGNRDLLPKASKGSGPGGPAPSAGNGPTNPSLGGGRGATTSSGAGSLGTGSGSGEVALGDVAPGDDVKGNKAEFEAAAASAAGRTGPKEKADPFAGLFGNKGAADPTGGIGNVKFGGQVSVDEKPSEDGVVANSKLSIFELINHRMEKFETAH